MLISFAVANFRSFSDEQTFSLIGSKRLGASHSDHLYAIPGSEDSVLRTSIIYGANGAGKSNLFKAVNYLKDMALKVQPKGAGTTRQSFRLPENAGLTSDFDVQFIANNKTYRYGIKVDNNFVREEWLLRTNKSREEILFERRTDDAGQVTVHIRNVRESKLKSLADVGGPANQTFLATIFANLKTSDYGKDVTNIYDWFRRLVLISPGASYRNLARRLALSEELLAFVGDFLKEASTGVASLKIERRGLTEELLHAIMPESIVQMVVKDLDDEDKLLATVRVRDGNEITIRKSDNNLSGVIYEQVVVKADHRTKDDQRIAFDLEEESDGTRRLINLIPALFNLGTKTHVYFIDEVDRSMHPIVVRAFIETFLKSCAKGQGQMIMTTHESSLLDLDLLRRDEIWFAEKNRENASTLYSLLDFKVRSDLEIRKHYLQGRFGAIPFVGGINRLFENEGLLEDSGAVSHNTAD